MKTRKIESVLNGTANKETLDYYARLGREHELGRKLNKMDEFMLFSPWASVIPILVAVLIGSGIALFFVN